MGTRYVVREIEIETNGDRLELLKEAAGVGMCNITKCCTVVCPQGINITDNGIIPLKERVADVYWDPLGGLVRKLHK